MTNQTIEILPIGTRIKFPRNITADANEEHPALLFAEKGELGRITGYNTFEGYMVETDGWPKEFGATRAEFEVAL